MTTKADALRALIEKVEAGDVTWADCELVFQGHDTAKYHIENDYCIQAFRGSLDAAKALHQALLPGWSGEARFSGYGGGQAAVWNPRIAPHHGGTVRVNNDDPARAWLIVVLRALLSMEGEG